MGHLRRQRRQLARLRAQEAGASESDVGGGFVELPDAPTSRGWLARASSVTGTALGATAGFLVGGPVGAALLGGIGAAVDWVRR